MIIAACLLTNVSASGAKETARQSGAHLCPHAATLRTLIASPLGYLNLRNPESKVACRKQRQTSGSTLPIFMSVSPQTVIGGIENLSVTIQVDQTGDSIQLGTDKPWLLNSPSLNWPHSISFPNGGSTTKTVTLTTNLTSSSQSVTLYACRSGVDASNPENWTVVKTISIIPIDTPGPSGNP
jgi:hypothetical protein